MKKELYYTVEQNVLIFISLLKKFGIKRIIVSPGTTNFTFVGSVQNDDFFILYSSADERSAAYLACGMAAESGEPVVITCTGATASRNYLPALTEAYYRKLSIIAVMSHCGVDYIGNLIPQQIDRRIAPSDTFVEKIVLNPIYDSRDEQYTILQSNKALSALFMNGGGPVQVELVTRYSRDFSVKKLPDVRKISAYTLRDRFPELPEGAIYIVIGSHKKFSEDVISSIDHFCSTHNAVVLCDHTSNYHGDYGYNLGLIGCQREFYSELRNCRLIIHLGEISGDYYGMSLNPQSVWRVNEDGTFKDLFNRLSAIFVMTEKEFFDAYSTMYENSNSLKNAIEDCLNNIYKLIPELPFSNIWIAQQTINKLPKNSVLHLGILHSLRSWDFFTKDKSIDAYSNVGAFGIDGVVSTCLGASWVNLDRLFFCIVGDLAFFYDMNSIGNRSVNNNLRIMLVNNGGGTEFRNYSHPAHDVFGDKADDYMAAVGHYGNKSSLLVKHYVEDLGFLYLSANDKDEYLNNLPIFINPQIGERPILFEVFTDSKDESEALEKMCHLLKHRDAKDGNSSTFMNFKNRIKQSIKYHYNDVLDKLKL